MGFFRSIGRGIGWLWNHLGPAKKILIDMGIEEFKRRNPKSRWIIDAIEQIYEEYQNDPRYNIPEDILHYYLGNKFVSEHPNIKISKAIQYAKIIVELKKIA